MKYTTFNHREYEAHMMVYAMIKPRSKVLDLGCATGYFAKELKKKHCDVTGVEYEQKAVAKARQWCDHVYQGNLDEIKTVRLPYHAYDYVLLLDVLEHVQNRRVLLKQVHQWLAHHGKLIISTPNIAHMSIRFKLLFGDFTYTNYGILDKTHVHFFTKKSLMDLLYANGWRIEHIEATADFGQIPITGRMFRHIPKKIQYFITQRCQTLLGIQYIVSCKKVSFRYA